MKLLRILALVLVVFVVVSVPAMAQTTPGTGTYVISGQSAGACLGAAITIVGAGIGFGKIGAAALEGMARQPEVAAKIQTGMIIIAALLEGATFFALAICIIIALGLAAPLPL